MDASLLAALVPPRWSVLGYELRPFCLGHRVLLTSIQSPFMVGIGPDGLKPTDILLAVQICGRSWEDGLVLCSDTDASDSSVRRMLRRVIGADFQKAAEILGEYFTEGSASPGYQTPGASGGVGRWTPWEQTMRVSLMRDLGLSESEVMNRPLTRNWWDLMTLKEDEGVLTISTTEEKEFADEMFRRADALCQGQQN
jgi:hypothetical protein